MVKSILSHLYNSSVALEKKKPVKFIDEQVWMCDK